MEFRTVTHQDIDPVTNLCMSLTESREVANDDMGDGVGINRGNTSINVRPVRGSVPPSENHTKIPLQGDIIPETENNIMREHPPDPRDPHDPTRQTSTGSAPVPLTRVRNRGYTTAHLKQYGITRDEAEFLQAVVKAMNGELDGYTLTESMTSIKRLYEIDEEKLQELGFLKSHSGVSRRKYYSITADGQEACRLTKKHGFDIGDAGDDTPHQVGVELTEQYYAAREDVHRAEASPSEGRSRTDLVVVDTDFNRVATVEVEGGRVSADPGGPDDASPGINDHSSLRHDYRVLADASGESVWVVRNHEIAANVLRALNAGDGIPVTFDRDTLKGIETGRVNVGAVNDELDTVDAPGIDRVLTFQQIRNRL